MDCILELEHSGSNYQLISYKNVDHYGLWTEAATRGVLLKKRLWHRCFPVSFAKFLRTPFLQYTSGRLLLYGLLQHSGNNYQFISHNLRNNYLLKKAIGNFQSGSC